MKQKYQGKEKKIKPLPPPKLDEFFGLYEVSERHQIPLKSIEINAEINEIMARVTYTQKYYNNSEDMLETEYFFPISADACYDGFRAKFGDKVIEGMIKEKEKAKEDYKEGVKKGDTVAYAEMNQKANDVMKVQIGNIPPLCEIEIEFSYLERVEVAMNSFNKFTIYSTLTPRYSKNHHRNEDIATLSNYPFIEGTDSNAYTWNVNINIKSDQNFSFIKSPTHKDKIDINYVKADGWNVAIITFLDHGYVPDDDFVLYYKAGDVKEIQTAVSKFEQKEYCSLVKFFPQMNTLNDNDAYLAALDGRDPGVDIEIANAKGEFIFLIDRSGSMYDDRIAKAKESLMFFLKSLPPDSYFNVASFGSEFYLLDFEKSIRTTEKSLQEAIDTIGTYENDMGGTEILQPLQFITNCLTTVDGYPRTIFLLTDGAVDNTKEVLEFIKQNQKNQRVFSIGIGSGCSTELIKESARVGYGTYEFVGDDEDVNEKVIHLLKNSISPYITDFSLEFEDKSMVSYTVPNVESIGYVLPNQLIDFFVIFNEKAHNKKTWVKFRFYNGTKGQYEEIKASLNLPFAEQDDSLIKLGMYKFYKSLKNKTNGFDTYHPTDADLALSQDISDELVVMSVKHQILTDKTAFICHVKEGNDVAKQIPTKKVLVPQIKQKSGGKKDFDSSSYSSEGPFDYDDDYDDLPDHKYFRTSSAEQKQFQKEAMERFERDLQAENMKLNDVDNYNASMSQCSNYGGGAGGINTLSNDALGFAEPTQPQKKIKKKVHKDSNRKMGIVKHEEDKSESEEECEKKKEKKKKKHSVKLFDIVKEQKLFGNWEANTKVATLMGISLDAIKEKIPEAVSKVEDGLQAWMTLVVLAFIETVFSDQYSSWELIYKKGVQWLKNNKKIAYDQYVKDAQAILE